MCALFSIPQGRWVWVRNLLEWKSRVAYQVWKAKGGVSEPCRIRTCDQVLKRHLLCQTELTAQIRIISVQRRAFFYCGDILPQTRYFYK
jgi:hypothetical protein